MYNLKKVIASICVIAMMLTTVAFAATYSDVAEDSAYYEAIETLNKLGIVTGYEDGTYKPEAGVTRAEMAALIARIQGYGESAAGQTATSFVDVPASHWASGYVASAASTGIINGYGDGNFGPDDSVLFEQAVKMIMAALGYTPYAEYNGGYPGGYLAAAQRYNVTANVSNATMGTEANRGTIAQLLANAIDTPLMQQVGWTTNGEVDYVICDGKNGNDYKTLMSEYLNVVKIRGVVTANTYTDIKAAQTIDLEDDATVEIAIVDAYDTTNKDFKDFNDLDDADAKSVSFLAGESDAADYIGKSVIAYVQEVDDEYAIVSIVEDTTRNDVLTIDLSQFKQINSGKFEYYKTASAKTATAVTLNDATVVYNNAWYKDGLKIFGKVVLNEGATLDGGMITLIDNNDTKGYDVIFVEVAETAVVDEAEEGYVAFKEMTSTGFMDLEVDEDDTDRVVKVTKDGEEIALADLAEWNVLSIIAASLDADYILAEVVSNEVVGTITSESKSASSAYPESGEGETNGRAYKIGSEKYDVAKGAYGVGGMSVGDGGTFYIDKYGKIAAFNEDSALASGIAANYAYVTAATVDEDILTGKQTAIIQMITADGVVALNVKATGAKLNDNSFDANDYSAKEEDSNSISKLLKGKMIKYSKNSSNNITNITTFDKVADMDGNMAASSGDFDAEDNKIGDFYVDADAMIFFVDPNEAEDSFLGTVADLADGENYKVMGRYADKKAEDNNIVIIESVLGNAGKKAGLAVITSVGTSESEDGEEILAIEAFANGEEIVADTTADVCADVKAALTEGDIVKIKLNADGVISALTLVYDFATEDLRGMVASAKDDIATLAANPEFVYKNDGLEKIDGGKVTGYRDSSKTVYFDDGKNEVGYKLSQATNVIVVDSYGRNLEVKKGSASSFKNFKVLYDETVKTVDVTINDDIEFAPMTEADAQQAVDYVYVRMYDNRVTDVVIVKGPEDIRIVNTPEKK